MLTSLQTYQSTYLPRIVLITEDDHQYYLVMDYVEGGNLSAFRQAKHHLPEDHARALARSILSGIADIHRLSVAHFNISPDNILLEPNLCDIVLCDFGYAWDLRHSHLGAHAVNRGGDASQIHGIGRIDHGRLASPRCGSLQYAAPEVIGCDKEFGLAVDMWSVGVILFQLLCGRLPFEDLSKRALKEKIAIGKYEFSGTEWNDVSRGAKQFISTLLHPDPQVRMTVGEALAHPWMTQPLCHDDWLIDDSPKSLRRHKNGRHRPSLVHRLWSRLRSSSSLEGPVSSPLSTPPHLKSNTYSQFVDLSKASTLSMDTMTQVSASPLQISSKSLSWESSFPKPLDDHRRTRSWAEF